MNNSNNPFQREGVGVFNWPEWVGYTFGSLLIVIGICIFFLFQKKAKTRKENYKKEQLAEYNKKYNKNEKDYKRTGMYLPGFEIAKASAPVMMCALLVFIGIAWIVGNTLWSL